MAERHLDHGRTILLTDAVVAIAMTLLVLPLVDVAGDFDTASPGLWWQRYASLAVSFVVSFLVIFAFWSALGIAQRRLEEGDRHIPGVTLLTMLWLLVIVFLPFPTAVVGHRLDTTSVPFYVGTMLVASSLTSGIVTLAARAHPNGDPRWWPWSTTAVFAVCTVIGLVSSDWALYGLLVLIPLRLVERRLFRPLRAKPRKEG